MKSGLYCIVPEGIKPQDCPVDSFLLTSKLAPDAVLAYRTALDFFGKLYSTTNEFFYLSTREVKPFVFRGICYRSVAVPAALKFSNQSDYAVETIIRAEQEVRVTNLERTFVDVLDRPTLCGSWEEIWRSLENIEYLDLDIVLQYTLLLNSPTIVAKVGYFLEMHQDEWKVSNKYLDDLKKHIPKQPIYLDRYSNEPNKLFKQWNLIVPLSIVDKQWEEPSGDI